MTSDDRHLPAVPHHDLWVVHSRGRLFTRSWQPPDPAAARGHPIVLFHDSLGCVALWRDLPARLARATGRRVVAYDRLGFGRSDPLRARPSTDFVREEATEILPALREQLDLPGFVALGHSVGGAMAVHGAAEAGAACEALVTVAAQAFVEARTLDGLRAAQAQFQDPVQRERLARHHGERADWVLDAWLGRWLDPAYAGWSLAEVLPRVGCRTLVVHGEHDEYGSTRHPETIGALCGGPARVEILPGVGHVPHREHPARLAALVADFLAA